MSVLEGVLEPPSSLVLIIQKVGNSPEIVCLLLFSCVLDLCIVLEGLCTECGILGCCLHVGEAHGLEKKILAVGIGRDIWYQSFVGDQWRKRCVQESLS